MEFINDIIRFSLKHRTVILAGAVLITAGGLYSARQMDIDVFPDLTAPTVAIMTDTRGMAAEETERLVTFPIEAAVNGATGVRRTRSSSMQGYSFVWAEFDWGTDVYRARQTVSEKMSALGGALPDGVTPVLAPQSSVMGEIMMISLQADSTSLTDLRTLADWVIKPTLLATGGVSQVSNMGGDVKQYQIQADPARMKAYGVSLRELEETARSFCRNATGGVIRDYGNEYALRGIARSADLDELGGTFVKMSGGQPVTLSDVASVVAGSAVRTGYASRDALPAVLLSVSKQPDANTLRVTREIEKNLETLRGSLPPDVRMDTRVFRQADFIEASVGNVGRALLEGAVFAAAVIFLFLSSARTTLISVIAIPVSLLGTCLAMRLLGMNINTMTLGGMCIAIGSLVDDAIIDVENVYKRLRQNHMQPPESRRPAGEIVFEASAEIRASILNATFIIIAAFMPLFFLSGMEGRMLKPLGTAYILSLFMSLAVAMTLTPLLCRLSLTSDRYLEKNRKESRFASAMSAFYGRSLMWALNHRKTVAGATLALLAIAAGLAATMGHGFLPDFNEGSAVVSAQTRPGVSLDVSERLGTMMERELLQVDGVTGTARRTGRGDLDEHSLTSSSAEIEVQFDLKGRSREQLFNDMRSRLAGIPGVSATIGQPLGHRIDHMLSGTRANIAIKIFGSDLGRMYLIGNQIKSAINGIDGLVDVNVEQQVETPQLQVRANRTALARYGVSVEEFNRFVETAFNGKKVADLYEGQRRFDVTLRLAPTGTGGIEDVRDALIVTDEGHAIPLSAIADIVSAGGPDAITRENARRKLVVSANVSGRDAASAVSDIRQAVQEKVTLPEGYDIVYGGQFESASEATRRLLAASILSLAVIFLLLYGEFRDASLSALVLLNLPFALIGGILALVCSSRVISIPSIIGFITLLGVATRNGILLVSRYQHARQAGTPLRETVLTGSSDRLAPILMTALSSALALVPLVVSGDLAGNEMQSPMAVVVLGGLLSSTLLNIYVMPVVYEWLESRTARSKNSEKAHL